jgi:hypothetical protein
MADEIGDGGVVEGLFDGGEGIIEALMEGAELFAVGVEAEGAGADAGDGVDRVDDLEDGDLVGGSSEGEAAVEAAL